MFQEGIVVQILAEQVPTQRMNPECLTSNTLI